MRRLVIYIIILLLILPCIPWSLKAQPQTIIKGLVVNPQGNPIPNVLVAVYDPLEIRIKSIVFTRDDGSFETSVPRGHKYWVYFIAYSEEKNILTHIPVFVKIDYKDVEVAVLKATLYPASPVLVKGYIVYIGGRWEGYYDITILYKNGILMGEYLKAGQMEVKREFQEEKIPVSLSLMDVFYGNHRVVFRRLQRNGYLKNLNFSVGYVPTNVESIVKISTRVIDERGGKIKIVPLEFTIGSPNKPLVLGPGDSTSINLLTSSLKRLIEVIEDDITDTEKLIERFELIGFYLAPERSELLRAKTLVEEARTLYESGANPELVIERLERAYVIATQELVKRLYFLKTVALEGASLLPYFIALFAAAVAFYFTEAIKKKFYLFIIFFLAFMGLFTLSYPGFTLLWENNRNLFLATMLTAFLGVIFLIFYLPTKIKEAALPGAIRKGSIIAVTFSIAKRFSRLKRTRTIITVFSLAALIWAFTVLASVSSVYGIWATEVPKTLEGNYLTIKRLINETKPSPLGYYSDYSWLKEKLGYELAVRVYNDPDQSITIIVEYGKKEIELKALLGLSPVEKDITGITKAINGEFDKIGEEKTIILPSSIASKLGVNIGDIVTLRVYRTGLAVTTGEPYKVIGILNENVFDEIKDVDGRSIKPVVKIKGKYVPANSTDIAIIPWKDALMSLVVEEGKTFSSAFFIYSLSCKGNIDLLKSLAYSYIERRGESYYAYLNLQDKCIKIFFGQRMENVLARNVDFIIPIAIVIFNVLMSMYSIVNERKREIYIFNAIGFNPVHIALLFLAESVVYGLLAGGIGYMAGLVTFRAMSVFARTLNLIVREKLEWYWSIIAILISIGVAMIAAFKPALNAAMMYTPSKVVRVKVAEKEREKREEKILKTYAGKTYPLRLKVKEEEAIIFFSYLYTRLSDLQSGYRERVENLVEEEEEEYPDGRLIKRFKFNYVFVTEEGKRLVTENELRCTKHPKEKFYRVELESSPMPGQDIPVQYLDRVASTVNDILDNWEREKKYLLRGR